MTYRLDAQGYLDLSACSTGLHYDMFEVRDLAHEYYFDNLIRLVAWDGLPVTGMGSERKFLHLACKHGKDKEPINPLTDIDLERVRRLPLIPPVVAGRMDVDVYRQVNRKGNVDSVEVVVAGPDRDYVVVLGCFPGHYVLRSAYPAGSSYVHGKIMRDGQLVERIRP